jgi:hypothetical protein
MENEELPQRRREIKIHALNMNTREFIRICSISAAGVIASTRDAVSAAPGALVKGPIVFAAPAMLEAAKRRLAAPLNDGWDAAWKVTFTRATGSLKLTPEPYQGTEYLRYFHTGIGEAGFARDAALVFALTGDDRFLGRARESLLAYARDTEQNPTPAAKEPTSQGLVIARVMAIFCYAYSLIYDALKSPDRSTIENWMAKMIPLIRPDQKHWVDHGFFGQPFNNHIGAHIMGLVVLGFTLRDPKLIDYTLQSGANSRNYSRLIQGAILMPGDALCADDPTLKNGAPAVQAGEVYDRYRSFEGKGLAYSLLHLRELTLIAEVAANNSVSIHGADPYHITGTLGRGLEAAYTFYADFFLAGDASVRGGYYAKEKVIPPDACLYELARRHFPGNEKIRQVVAARDRTADDGETFGRTAAVTHGATHT